jgi:DNA polymerase-4
MASSYKKPHGLTLFETEEEAARVFAPLPVEKIVGIGPSMQAQLNRLGVMTIGDLAACSGPALQESLGDHAATLIAAARGHAEGAWWGEEREDKNKTIGHSLTFEADTRDMAFLGKVMLMLSEQVSRRLREDNLVAKRVTVTLRFSDFKTITRAVPLPALTSDPFAIYQTALKVLKAQDLKPKPLRLIGVTAKDLEEEGTRDQLVLFDDGGQKKKPLFAAMDKLKEKYGEDSVTWGTLAEKKESGKKPPRRGVFNPFSKPKDTKKT